MRITDYKPISLLGSTIKTISKVLANRLVPKLQALVEEQQTGFIKERSILYGIVITQEVIHQTKKTKRNGFLLKFDFQKAYDRANWECIMEILDRRKFGPRWKGWIKKLVVSSKTRVINSEGEGREIRYRRGL